MASFVVVLPALPVIAMTLVATAVRTACASSLQRLERVGHFNQPAGPKIRTRPPPRRPGLLYRPGNPRSTIARGAAGQHVGDERMSVEPRPAKRDEQVPGLKRSAVGDDVTNRRVRARQSAASHRPQRRPNRAST